MAPVADNSPDAPALHDYCLRQTLLAVCHACCKTYPFPPPRSCFVNQSFVWQESCLARGMDTFAA